VAALLRHLEAGEEGPGTWTAGLEPDAVQVLTAHGAAGLEFDTVIVVGAVEGSFPSLSRPEPMFDLQALDRPVGQSERNRRRLQDERRLFGMVTGRARRRVLFTASSPEAGDAEEGARSRFVAEAGVAWQPAPSPPFPEPLTAPEASGAWRRLLADPARSAADRLAALDGLLVLGEDAGRWWFQRAWTGSDRPLHEAIRVSHSKLSSLENCDLQFVLSQEIGLEGPAGYQAWVGSLVHRLIEDAENGALERTEAALVAAADERWRAERFPSLAVSEAFRRLVTRAMLPAWVREYGGAPAVAREIRFEFEFEGALVVGVIDRIGSLQGGGSCVTDYKTGKSANAGKAEENLQLGMYYLAVSQAPELEPFRPVKGIELVFLRDQGRYDGEIRRASKGFNARESAEYGQVMAEKLGGLIHHLEDLQRTEVYRPNPNANCRFCDFKELCSLWPEGQPVFPIEGVR
jgi:RecB family exonuclease